MRWFVGHGPAVTAILPLQAMRQCAVGYADGSVAVYSIETSVEEVVVKAHAGAVRKMLYDEEKRLVTSVGEDGFVKMWEIVVGVNGGSEAQELNGEKSAGQNAFNLFSFHEETVHEEKKKRAELVMLKSFQVEGVELIEIVKVKNGVLMTAGVSRLKKWGVCYKQAK